MKTERTLTTSLGVYELELSGGDKVRFHEYEMEDGGVRIEWKRVKFGWSERMKVYRFGPHKPDFETYREAFIPFTELDSRTPSPIKIGEIVYKRKYEHEHKTHLIGRSYTKYEAVGPQEIEWDGRTFIESKSG